MHRALGEGALATTAPRNFTVFGLRHVGTQPSGAAIVEEDLLTRFDFDAYGAAEQTFFVERQAQRYYRVIKVQINANWGSPRLTCLYRFRVIGDPHDQP